MAKTNLAANSSAIRPICLHVSMNLNLGLGDLRCGIYLPGDSYHKISGSSGDDCISKFWQCDGHADCKDGSDEVDCDPFLKTQHSCGASEFKCVESGICLPQIWYCDGERDCSHGEDEIDCSHTCNEKDLFACKYVCCLDNSVSTHLYFDCHLITFAKTLNQN